MRCCLDGGKSLNQNPFGEKSIYERASCLSEAACFVDPGVAAFPARSSG